MARSLSNNRGGGFKITAAKGDYIEQDTIHIIEQGVQLSPRNQDNLSEDVYHGKNFAFFQPKRFNRYPRFTIFFNKQKDDASKS